jgi:hypothetical protein
LHDPILNPASPSVLCLPKADYQKETTIRELSRNIKILSNIKDKTEQENLMQKSGELIASILFSAKISS